MYSTLLLQLSFFGFTFVGIFYLCIVYLNLLYYQEQIKELILFLVVFDIIACVLLTKETTELHNLTNKQ